MATPTISFGASVRGPLHAHECAPNQDAWLRTEGRFGSLIVVCDGLGSRVHSHLGARAACLAAREAVSRWYRSELPPVPYLTHLVELFWRLRIYPIDPRDAATTCLLALACPDGTWVVGGIGDGLAAVLGNGQDVVQVLGNRGEAWGNETMALGMSVGARGWQMVVLPPSFGERVAVLATDGISDDIIPEKLEAFVRWLLGDFGPLDPRSRWRQLVSELKNWPTPKHLDDKTIAVLVKGNGQRGGEP